MVFGTAEVQDLLNFHFPLIQAHIKTCLRHPQNKNSHWTGRRAPPFAPVKRPEGPRQRITSAHRHRVNELSNQVWELKQLLTGASRENQLLRRIQSRHVVALKHFQDSQAALPQILQKHDNEVRALRECLHKAQFHKHALTIRLRDTEDRLMHTKDAVQKLQLLSQDRNLGEREELAQQLGLISAELERKTKRIQDLERNLELSTASFYRQINAESRKTLEARDMSRSLQEHIRQLNQKIKEKERELESHFIYSHRIPKDFAKRGKTDSKSVQTGTPSPLPVEGPTHSLELQKQYDSNEDSVTELDQKGSAETAESLAVCFPDTQDDRENDNEQELSYGHDSVKETTAEECSDGEEECHSVTEGVTEQTGCAEIEQTLPEKKETSLGDFFGDPPKTNKSPKPLVRTRRQYTFKQTIQNLHCGRPAYAPRGQNFTGTRRKSMTSQGKTADQDTSVYDPFFTGDDGNATRQESDPVEELINNKKVNLMKELFGQVKIFDQVPQEKNVLHTESSDLDHNPSCHKGHKTITRQDKAADLVTGVYDPPFTGDAGKTTRQGSEPVEVNSKKSSLMKELFGLVKIFDQSAKEKDVPHT
ncbi:lebercilin-like protein [Chanos chanos]|uniref:Lebercilin-like protein n=1 Tax=Chanos chanos TaxID=29144 RepID=A0A6J2VP87_CHACN|nr:lebercilin-like protein [Chanos chanos]